MGDIVEVYGGDFYKTENGSNYVEWNEWWDY
jgi:hypothetical protein